jgi:hypothetical protein
MQPSNPYPRFVHDALLSRIWVVPVMGLWARSICQIHEVSMHAFPWVPESNGLGLRARRRLLPSRG